MAITSYSELQTAVQNWLARTDLSARVPEFIALTEGQMSRKLWSLEGEKRATSNTTAGDAFVSLPTDLRYIRAAKLQTDPTRVLTPVSHDFGRRYYSTAANSKPHNYAVIGQAIELFPTPDAAYTIELTYIEGVPELSDTNTSNLILNRYPDAYLHGALFNAHEYLMDEERASYHEQRFERAMQEISADFERARYGAGVMIRSDYYPHRNRR
jgi:hypothetical protein